MLLCHGSLVSVNSPHPLLSTKQCLMQQLLVPLLQLQSFLYFAGMNTSAAICHCLTPLSSPFKPLMVALDVGFTSAASICLCLGALTSGERDVSKQKLYNRLSCWTPPAALAVAVLGNHVGPLHAVTGLRWAENIAAVSWKLEPC